MPAKKKKTVSKKFDFDDEWAVKRAMAKALDVPEEDVEIETVDNLDSFRTGNSFYKIEVGRKEYFVAENEDTAEELAVAIVKQDLEESPENFNSDFIQSHINIDRLKRDLYSDLQNSNYETIKEDAERSPERFIKDNNIDWPEPSEKLLRSHAEAMSDETDSASSIYEKLKSMDAEDQWNEMGEEPTLDDSVIEKIADEMTDNQLKDPVSYLVDIYGSEDGVKKAIEIGGIDEDAAAKEAVSTDGVGHFLSSYDGHMQDGPSNLVYWRHN